MESDSPDPTPRTIRPRWTWFRDRFVEGLRLTVLNRQIVEISTQPQPGEFDLQDQVLLPGLVNPHTHLEFSSLASPIPYEETFASWIQNVVAWRRSQSDADYQRAIQQGMAESSRAGVSAVGEIATRPVSAVESSPCQVVFREALGLGPATVAPQLAVARQHLEQLGSAPRCLPALSPHAPYSLHPDLFSGIVELARTFRCSLAMHLAETVEELELLKSGTGPLAELFASWGLWHVGQVATFRTPRQVLQALSELPRVLIIHGNYLTPDEQAYIAARKQMSVVYCPRTHTYFRHSPYPLNQMLQQGIRVVLGTDSRASNPDLDPLADLRHAVQLHPEVSPAQWIDMVTVRAAEALGVSDRFGVIEVGREARFCAVSLPSDCGPEEAVLSGLSENGLRDSLNRQILR